MKVSIRRWLGFAALPAALLMLGLSSPAHAKVPSNIPNATHACDNDPNPSLLPVFTRSENNPENGNIIIHRTDGQDCDLSAADINATGQIFILVENGGKINIPNAQNIRSLSSNVFLYSTENDVLAPNSDIKADLLVNIEAGVETDSAVGTIRAKDVISNLANIMLPSFNGDANILIRAQKDVFVKKVKTTGTLGVTSNRSGNVQIDANLHSSNNGDMSIGVGGNIEEIDIRSLTGGTDEEGKPSPRRNEIGVRITNGGPSSIGDLKVNDLNAIKVQQSQSRSGLIELNTQKGYLTLGAGTLNTSSQNDFGGGNIYLFAEKIITVGDVTLDNSQPKTAPNITRQIVIAASHIDFSQSAKFTILSNGNGISNSEPATVYVLPQGGIIPNVANDVQNLLWNYSFNGGFFNLDKSLYFDGGTSADLIVKADGDAVQIAVTGHPIVFDGNDVLFQTKGDHNIGKHEIVMGYFGAQTAVPGIDFGNSGTFEFFVRGEGNNAAGGDIQVQTSGEVIIDATNLNLKANGPANKPGDGGTIFFSAPTVTASDNTKVKFLADASEGSTGNSQISRNNRRAIYFDAGQSTIPIGTQVKQFNFSANGGRLGGNGGAIQIVNTGVVRIRDQATVAIEAKARGQSGDGGVLLIENTQKTVFVQNDNDDPRLARRAIDVSGGSDTGVGGIVLINKAEHKVPNNPNDPWGELKPIINVNALIKVDAGVNESFNSFGGAIGLNGITCAQNRLQQSWPKTVWQCGSTGNAAKMIEGANFLPGNLKAQLASTKTPQNPDVQLYEFDNDADFNTFFNATTNTVQNANGVTNPLVRVSAVMARSGQNLEPIEIHTNSPTTVQANTIHELGHQLDYIWGLKSAEQPFISADLNDQLSFDSITPCTTVWPTVICQKYSNPQQSNYTILGSESNFTSSNQEPFGWLFLNDIAYGVYVSAQVNENGTLVPYIDDALVLWTTYKGLVHQLVTNPPNPVN